MFEGSYDNTKKGPSPSNDQYATPYGAGALMAEFKPDGTNTVYSNDHIVQLPQTAQER